MHFEDWWEEDCEVDDGACSSHMLPELVVLTNLFVTSTTCERGVRRDHRSVSDWPVVVRSSSLSMTAGRAVGEFNPALRYRPYRYIRSSNRRPTCGKDCFFASKGCLIAHATMSPYSIDNSHPL